ncbi:MAG: dipeptidase [Hyphomicrobiaceae bacterium]|nr:dipeptidase [Hyphomicrobiaceae bacterium]
MSSDLHKSAIVIDGLVVSRWSRSVFEHMQRGGLTAANCTCSVWENFDGTMRNIGRFKRWLAEHADILRPVKSAADIRAAKAEGKVGIILGFQNTSGLDDLLDSLSLYKELGVGIIQLTYNTQNLVGAGCWEEHDSGLSGFGREVVGEMNRLGIVVDLSHVGPRTSADAIRHSARPCVYSHVCPAGLFSHPRNKTDEELKAIVERGGFVGVATFPPFLPKGADTTLDDCVDVFEYMIGVCGEGNVGIGTDFTQDQDEAFFDWLRHDKGYARRMVAQRGTAPMVKGFETLADYPRLTAAFERRGWPERRIRGVLGENWLRFLGEAWTPRP